MQYRDPPPAFVKLTAGLDPASVKYVDAVNRYLDLTTADLITQLSFDGINWIGIVHRDDRRSVDVLASLPFVDPKRIGCVGLSGGVFRSTYLAGMDPRIRAAVIVGWMSTLPSIGRIPYSTHSDNAFGLHSVLDHPDVASLGAPQCAILVQNCRRDRLFPQTGHGGRSRQDPERICKGASYGAIPGGVLRCAAQLYCSDAGRCFCLAGEVAQMREPNPPRVFRSDLSGSGNRLGNRLRPSDNIRSIICLA